MMSNNYNSKAVTIIIFHDRKMIYLKQSQTLAQCLQFRFNHADKNNKKEIGTRRQFPRT